MRRRGLRLAIILLFTLVVVGAASNLEAVDCWYVDHSFAYNNNGNSWCQGWWSQGCMYCWDTDSGESCAGQGMMACIEFRW